MLQKYPFLWKIEKVVELKSVKFMIFFENEIITCHHTEDLSKLLHYFYRISVFLKIWWKPKKNRKPQKKQKK